MTSSLLTPEYFTSFKIERNLCGVAYPEKVRLHNLQMTFYESRVIEAERSIKDKQAMCEWILHLIAGNVSDHEDYQKLEHRIHILIDNTKAIEEREKCFNQIQNEIKDLQTKVDFYSKLYNTHKEQYEEAVAMVKR